MTDKERLFQYIDDLIASLDAAFADNKINSGLYTRKTNEILNRYQIAEGMSREREWLEWKVNNCLANGFSEEYYEKLQKRLLELDGKTYDSVTDNPENLIGVEVQVPGKGYGRIVKYSEKFITVAFDDNKFSNISYELKTALRCHSIRFKDIGIQAKYELFFKNKDNDLMPAECSFDKIDRENSLNDYINFAKSAINCSLLKNLFSVVLVIHANDDMEYYDALSKIKELVFSVKYEEGIYQDSLINGARRWDASVEAVFKKIYNPELIGIHSIDIRDFSTIDPLFIELVQSIRSSSDKAHKIFAFRIKDTDRSTPGLLKAKIPVFEFKLKMKSTSAYAEELYSMWPNRLKGNYSDIKDILEKIIEAERTGGNFTGEKSLDYIALNISYYINSKSLGRSQSLDSNVLTQYYKDFYKSEIDKKSALERLREMIGFGNVVDLAEQIIAGAYQAKILSKNGIPMEKAPRHIVFRGPSGCGKTTAARLISEALNEACISKGFYEVNARSLCGRYLGETRCNVQAAIKSADDGILFIDEAYALAIGDEYGAEAISTLLTEMENPNSNLIIIFAGYAEEMDSFLNSNPGLRSRIGYKIDFKPYDQLELCNICLGFIKDFEISSSAKERICTHFSSIPQSSLESPNFGLARYSRNIASKIKSVSARRHWLAEDNSADISVEDVEVALSQLTETERPKVIGFMG